MKNQSLNFKVIAIVAILVLGGGIISFFGLSKMAEIRALMAELTNVLVKRDQATSVILDNQRRVTILNKEIIIEQDPSKMSELEKNILAARETLTTSIGEYEKIASKAGQDLAVKYRSAMTEWFAANAKIRELAKANNIEEASQLTVSEEIPKRDTAMAVLRDMNKLTADRLEQATIEADEAYSQARNIVMLASLLSLVIGISVTAVVLRALARTIDQVIASLRDNTNQVTSASSQIAASSEELSQAATEQAASIEETAASIEEMNSMIQKNSENSRSTADFARTSEQNARRGKEVVQAMIESIGDINTANERIMRQVNESNEQIGEIVKVIAEIGNKTKVINDIVFQTKLLSFNASVEAARAGEHGKGFAVVAEEVGNLAQMSGNSAKEIASMLDSSISKVERIVKETKEGVERLIADGKAKVEAGTTIARECGEVLETIVGNIGNVSQMAGEISTASHEQARGAQEITRAMSQLDQVTQQNTAASEETASAAEELSAQADQLRSVVQTLILAIKGANSHESGSTVSHSSNHSAPVVRTPTRGRGADVIPLGQRKQARAPERRPSSHGDSQAKMAVGADVVPSESDPRFKEL